MGGRGSSGHPAPRTVPDRITQTCLDLLNDTSSDAGPLREGGWVSLTRLRERLRDVPRAELDAALRQMYRSQRVNLIPQSNQRALTQQDRDAAFYIGAEHKHHIYIDHPHNPADQQFDS
jgi:hypothetical protein